MITAEEKTRERFPDKNNRDNPDKQNHRNNRHQERKCGPDNTVAMADKSKKFSKPRRYDDIENMRCILHPNGKHTIRNCYCVVWTTLSLLMSAVSRILPVRVISVVSIRESFSCLLLCSNHLFHCLSEFFVVSWIFFAEVLKLPPSHDSVGESFDYFSLCDVMYLSS